MYNAAAIPQPLAEEVAHHVDSKFYQLRIRGTKEATMTEEEIAEFNAAVGGPTNAANEAAVAAGTATEN